MFRAPPVLSGFWRQFVGLFVGFFDLPDKGQPHAINNLAQPSQFSRSEAGMPFVFSKGIPKVSTTF